MTYLLADTATGVYEVESLEDQGCEILSQEDFYSSLASIQDGEVIGAEVDAEWYSRIDADYQIQFAQ
jgi:hypothetical protein